MAELQKVSRPRCILLAAHYAAESNVEALRTLTQSRQDAFEIDLVLRLILTFLPENTDPSSYSTYLHEIATRKPLEERTTHVDTSPVEELSDARAHKQFRRLHLLPLAPPAYPFDLPQESLTLFLVHRAHRIDERTGLLDLILHLIVPFIGQSEYLRTWFVSTILPLLRLGYEYYPQSFSIPSLKTFNQLSGSRAVESLLYNAQHSENASQESNNLGRDLRGVAGPWMCGSSERKRRRLNNTTEGSTTGQSERARRSSLDLSKVATTATDTDDWECLFTWLFHTAMGDFKLTTAAFSDWDGPGDVDLGGFDDGHVFIDEDLQRRMELRYAQTAFASAYAVEGSDVETMAHAFALLTRLASLLDFEAPSELSIDPAMLPVMDITSPVPLETTSAILLPDRLLQAENPLTQPSHQGFLLLELFVQSANVLAELGYNLSIRNVAKMYLYGDSSDQLSTIQKILHTLTSQSKKDDEQWNTIRSQLLWLWSGGVTVEQGTVPGKGIFGKCERLALEKELLNALIDSAHYHLAIKTYIQDTQHQHWLPMSEIEEVVLASAMHHYDNASNGNRTRGGMKRASDIVSNFAPYFPSSEQFRQTKALLAATHALSFYSLILQHGVPFQPVNIRVSSDPLSLLKKVLDQNSRSYTHLDDLISIGQNLVISAPVDLSENPTGYGNTLSSSNMEQRKVAAERRVTGMAIEAALAEDDFETAYSYVVNRLSPPSATAYFTPAPKKRRRSMACSPLLPPPRIDEDDDISWRAALDAGRHRSSPISSFYESTSPTTSSPPALRRLEQRMELLSQALLLAPPSHLPEVLVVWQECEAEMTSLLDSENEAEQRFNDQADRRLPGAFANDTVALQPRREVGRGAVAEAPMGLFDVARGAAAAFSKSAFPLRGTSAGNKQGPGAMDAEHDARVSSDLERSVGSLGESEDRVRKRDMVASAVTGGLASGLGWVLGATPVNNPDRG